jgi:hypothetical protein
MGSIYEKNSGQKSRATVPSRCRNFHIETGKLGPSQTQALGLFPELERACWPYVKTSRKCINKSELVLCVLICGQIRSGPGEGNVKVEMMQGEEFMLFPLQTSFFLIYEVSH